MLSTENIPSKHIKAAAKIARQTEAFLENGGKITIIDKPVIRERPKRRRVGIQVKERARRNNDDLFQPNKFINQ